MRGMHGINVALMFRFYRSSMMVLGMAVSVAVLAIAGACVLMGDGVVDVLPMAVMSKLILYPIFLYFLISGKKSDYCYYLNLGLSRRALLTGACTIDFLLFSVLTVIVCVVL